MQVDDLTAAMQWISSNTNVLGLDVPPEVYLMGHSSGAHVALLYLIRRAEDDAAREGAVGMADTGGSTGGNATALDSTGGNTGDNSAAIDSTGGDSGDNPIAPDSNTIGRDLDVEGFVGLSGVYDVHSHYLYESWR